MNYSRIFIFFLISVCSLNFVQSENNKFAGQENGCCYEQSMQQRSLKIKNYSDQGIPLDMIRKLNSITSEKQLMEMFVNVQQPKRTYGFNSNDSNNRPVVRVSRITDNRDYNAPLTDLNDESHGIFPSISGYTLRNKQRAVVNSVRTLSENNETKEPVSPKQATCIPELRTVNLKDVNDERIYYYPSCMRVERCGGCCTTELLNCQPILTEFTNYTIRVFEYTGKSHLEPRGSKIVTIEKHIKCKCDCKTKAKDCKPQQKYEESKCRCICTNKSDEEKCLKESPGKIWDGSVCKCLCRQVHECTTGYYFDENTCSCAKSKPSSFQPEYMYDENKNQPTSPVSK